MSNVILVADLHLTSVARDEYRWKLFSWLSAAVLEHRVQTLIILGDLTEAKDYHSSRLVNRVVDSLHGLHSETGVKIMIVPGNHDGLDPECPYFRFLGKLPFVQYLQVPTLLPLAGRQALFLPHTKVPESWATDLLYDAELVFMHQTVSGAKSETGISLEGMSANVLSAAKKAKIWSGDVHVPQTIGIVEYVGAPYPVRFGDVFKPRAVLLTDKLRKATSLPTPAHQRLSVRATSASDLAKLALNSGDQIKVRIPLRRSEFGGFDKIKRGVLAYCSSTGVDLCGLEVEKIEEAAPKIKPRGSSTQAEPAKSPAQVLAAWAEKQKLAAPLVEAGQRILATVVK